MPVISRQGFIIAVLLIHVIVVFGLLVFSQSVNPGLRMVFLYHFILVAVISWLVTFKWPLAPRLFGQPRDYLYNMAQFGRLAAGVLHEITGPLTVVRINLEALRGRETKSLKITRDRLEKSRQAMKHVQHILDSARAHIQRQDETTRFFIADKVRQAKELLAFKARTHQVDLEVNVPEDLQLRGSPVKFCQLLTNLIDNAIDSYGRKDDSEQGQVMVSAKCVKETTTLVVQDWGIGMSLSEIKHMFDPGFTTKHLNQGTGLGMAISKVIVEEDFGGSLSVTSVRGVGTAITVRLPCE